ncbi:MAG: response regulator [Blautia sp.]|nr:response regulator [Blautia sp.]
MSWLIHGMIYLGSALMVYNIYGFIHFGRQFGNQGSWEKADRILAITVILLVFFLLGYLTIGILGIPDLMTAGILFGGSIFVFIVCKLLEKIARQIQDKEHIQAELIASEASNHAKNTFLASVSHEMRTPMNVIIGLNDICLKDPTLTVETREHLKKVGASARHLLSLINNILVMNSLDMDSAVQQTSTFSLADTVDQVNAIVSVNCEEKGLTYHFSALDDLRKSYIGDELQLKQILFSLLDNAVKYTKAPGNVDFSIACEDSDGEGKDTFRFTVSDTGVGIDKDFLPRVFQVFSQEDASSTTLYGGSGLGLAVTKKIVEQLGGTITASSEKNVGSVFTILLPLLAAEEEVIPLSTDSISLEGKRILVVEDLPENAEIIQDLLELEGVITEHAENGKIALDMFLSSPPKYYDVILMDLRMPVMDGLTATREIRASHHPDAKTVPIAALTANAFESDVRQSLSAGMNVHLAKPADADLLYSTLKTLIWQNTVG